MTRSYRHEIETALDGGAPDHVPFTFYDLLYPPGFDPRPLQALGMGVCARRNVYTVVRPNVKTKTVTEPDGSVRTVYVTPVGTLTAVSRKAEAGMALLEHPIKRLDDYRAAEFIVRDTHYVADYDTFVREEERLGHSGIVIAHTGYSPLLDLQIIWIGQEAFCYELADHEDAVLSLYDVLAENQRAMYEVAAASPARYVLHDGNIVPTMLGPERIQRLVLFAGSGVALAFGGCKAGKSCAHSRRSGNFESPRTSSCCSHKLKRCSTRLPPLIPRSIWPSSMPSRRA